MEDKESVIDKLRPILAEIQRLHFSIESEIKRSKQRKELMEIIEKFPVKKDAEEDIYTWDIQK